MSGECQWGVGPRFVSGCVSMGECSWRLCAWGRGLGNSFGVLTLDAHQSLSEGWQTSRGHKRWIFVDKIGKFLWMRIHLFGRIFVDNVLGERWILVDMFWWIFMDTFLIVMKRVTPLSSNNLTQIKPREFVFLGEFSWTCFGWIIVDILGEFL